MLKSSILLLLNLGEHLAGAHRFHPPGRPDAGHRGETRVISGDFAS